MRCRIQIQISNVVFERQRWNVFHRPTSENFTNGVGKAKRDWQAVGENAGIVVKFRQAHEVLHYHSDICVSFTDVHKQRGLNFHSGISLQAWNKTLSPQIAGSFIARVGKTANEWLITKAVNEQIALTLDADTDDISVFSCRFEETIPLIIIEANTAMNEKLIWWFVIMLLTILGDCLHDEPTGIGKR